MEHKESLVRQWSRYRQTSWQIGRRRAAARGSLGTPPHWRAAGRMWLLRAAWLLAAAAAAAAPDQRLTRDTVYLRPRGWPQVECRLDSQHAANGEKRLADGEVDFWLRGALSRQFYACRLDAAEDARASVLATERGGLLPVTARWSVNLNKFRRSHWPANFQVVSATRTPQFSCLSRDTALPAAMFPLSARRPGAPWRKCFPLPDEPHGEQFLSADGVVTVAFSGGAPTVACAVSREQQPTSLPLHAILPPPYACFFATYLDFPSLSDPPAGDLFQKLVVDKWVAPNSSTFPPFQCWPSEDDPDRRFHFDVLFDGKHAHRCLFQGECPLCEEARVSTEASVPDSSSGDGQPLEYTDSKDTGADGITDGVTTPSLSTSQTYTIDY